MHLQHVQRNAKIELGFKGPVSRKSTQHSFVFRIQKAMKTLAEPLCNFGKHIHCSSNERMLHYVPST